MHIFYVFFIICATAQSIEWDVYLDHYKVNEIEDLVINTVCPRFSWKSSRLTIERNISQIAYQIQLRSLKDEWDSQQVKSSRSIHVSPPGMKDLQSATFYRFRLRIWTNNVNRSNSWTKWFRFRTFFFHIQSYINSHQDSLMWIGSNRITMNELRKEFSVSNMSEIQTAVVYISGLGYYELFLNGKKIDPSRKLDPGWTVYEKRTLMVSFDLSSMIKPGLNAFGVRLGNGWYGQEQYTPPVAPEPFYGPPRFLLILNILFENGEEMQIFSDQTWMGRQSAILHDSIYNGEFLDRRLERPGWNDVGFNDSLSLWLPAESMTSPLNETVHGQIVMQDMPPIRAGPDALHFDVIRDSLSGYISADEYNSIRGVSIHDSGILKPIATWSPTIGVQVFDLGQNMAGWCRLKFTGARGVGVYIRHGEILTPPISTTNQSYGEVYTENLLGATQSDTYVLSGDPNGEIYEPSFTYHGFRYVSVINVPNTMSIDDVECLVVHSETTLKGHFISSNPIINQIQQNIQWGQLNNLMSIPTDCPQRQERKGWLGDAALTVNEALYNFDLTKFYINFLHSIVDSQGIDGAVPDTVPFSDGDYPADPNWGSALPTIAWQLYRHTRDIEILSTFYFSIQKYVESVHHAYQSTGLAHLFYSYGDWVPPPPQPRTNESLTASFGFLHDVSLLINMSQILGFVNETQIYSSLYQQLAEEFHRVFYNQTSGSYDNGMQTPQILALSLRNVVPENLRRTILKHLAADIIDQDTHVTTGIIGTAHLFPLLSDNGYQEIALKLITSTTYPSYGYMFNNAYENATTLWELWNSPHEGPGMNSRNHIMFGSVGDWFYSHLAGFDFIDDKIQIRPRMLPEANKHLLNKIDCQLNTIYGLIHLAYTRDPKDVQPNTIQLHLHLPINAKAHLILEPLFPDAKCIRLIENGLLIWSLDASAPITKSHIEISTNMDYITIHLGSGQYQYEAEWKIINS